MNTFKVGDKFIWIGDAGRVLTAAEIDGMFVVTELGSAYLYDECIKQESKDGSS